MELSIPATSIDEENIQEVHQPEVKLSLTRPTTVASSGVRVDPNLNARGLEDVV